MVHLIGIKLEMTWSNYLVFFYAALNLEPVRMFGWRILVGHENSYRIAISNLFCPKCRIAIVITLKKRNFDEWKCVSLLWEMNCYNHCFHIPKSTSTGGIADFFHVWVIYKFKLGEIFCTPKKGFCNPKKKFACLNCKMLQSLKNHFACLQILIPKK
jgi:hypothetical protein